MTTSTRGAVIDLLDGELLFVPLRALCEGLPHERRDDMQTERTLRRHDEALRLNHPAIQVSNQLMYPVQIPLIVVFIRA